MTLEKKAMATQWKSLLDAPFWKILEYYNTHKTIPKGLDYSNKPTESIVRKAAVMYAIVNVVLSFDAHIFGGFCAAHFSGLPTEDLDIEIPDPIVKAVFVSHLPRIMALIFDIDATNIVFSKLEKNTSYCTSYLFCMVKDKTVTELKVDIATSCNKNKHLLPVTWGRAMAYKKSGFYISKPILEKYAPKMESIQKYLSNGEDLFIVNFPYGRLNIEKSKHVTSAQKKYYTKRFSGLQSQGYKLISPTGYMPDFLKQFIDY